MAKKKKCVIPVKNRDDLCCARAIVTMKEQADNGSQYKNLRQGFHIQERLAKLLHRGAGVVEGVGGYTELEKFQEFLGTQGYQLVVLQASRCIQ